MNLLPARFGAMVPRLLPVRSPKLTAKSRSGRGAWYSYYAGFSPGFVQDVLTGQGSSSSSLILDPWNGAGTTTGVATELGCSSWGIDINPAMVIVAKARLLGSVAHASEAILAKHIAAKAATYKSSLLQEEPLGSWFCAQSGDAIRNIERAIQHYLIAPPYNPLVRSNSLSEVSALAAFFYVALFRAVRRLLHPFQTSNPTWMKVPSSGKLRLRPSLSDVSDEFENQVAAMSRTSDSLISSGQHDETTLATIECGDSRQLNRSAATVDGVLGSPPYCTRLDYAIATRPELAVMGYDAEAIKALRDRMIGTATITKTTPSARPGWGTACNSFLERVENHKSRASDSYYRKNHLQYFDGLYRSLSEIDRVMRPGSPCVLVVQDSYYKEVHNDLPLMVEEMAQSFDWSLQRRYDVAVSSLASVQAHAKSYRTASPANESVLWFAKQGNTDGQVGA